jgi:hypothetical protein
MSDLTTKEYRDAEIIVYLSEYLIELMKYEEDKEITSFDRGYYKGFNDAIKQVKKLKINLTTKI